MSRPHPGEASSRLCLVLLLLAAPAAASGPNKAFRAREYDATDAYADHAAAGAHFKLKNKVAESIEAYRAATTFSASHADWITLGIAEASPLRDDVGREQALRDARKSFERALFYDRENDLAYDNLDSVQDELHKFEWSGRPGRPRWKDKLLSAPTPEWPKGLPKEVKVSSVDEFWAFLGGEEFQTQYFEKWPLLIRGKSDLFAPEYYSIEQMLSTWYAIGNGGYVPPYRNVNFLRGSLARKNNVKGLPPRFLSRTGMMEALRRGYNLQLLHGEAWEPSLTRYVGLVQKHTKTISSTNVYVTPPQRNLSTPAHTDFTCNVMTQINGRKRWRLWYKKDIWLPANKKYIMGRDEFEILSDEELGEPFMDVTLEPGDAVYVPRGCFHKTSTPAPDGESKFKHSAGDDSEFGTTLSDKEIIDQTSVHLTTHMAKLHDFGGLEMIIPTALGANKNVAFENRWQDAINILVTRDISFRKGLNFRPGWKEGWREKLHAVVDTMLDETDYMDEMRYLANQTLLRRMRLLFDQKHLEWGKSMWDGTLDHIPELPSEPDWDVDPVFMPSAAEVSRWAAPKRSRNVKCGSRGPRIPLKYVPQLYKTVQKTKNDADTNEILHPPKHAEARGMFIECLYESQQGQCKALVERQKRAAETLSVPVDADGSITSANSHAIIMIMYKRGRIMKRVLGDVTKQTIPSDIFIWNNNVSPKVRCKMMKLARKIASSAEGVGIRTLWMHQSPVNIGPPGSYALASTISAMYDKFIFIDDDCASPENLVNTFLEESKLFPKDMISTWGKLGNLWICNFCQVIFCSNACRCPS